MSTTVASVTVHRRPWALLVPISALLGFLAFISIVGSFLFSYPLGWWEGYAYGVPLDVAGVLMAFAAVRLPRGEPHVYKLAVAVMGAEILWSIYKVLIYGEHESWPFLVAAVVAMVMLRSRPVRRFVEESAR